MLKKIGIIFKKEFSLYFNSAIAYIFIVAFLVVSAWFFMNGFFLIAQADMRNYFQLLPWIFLFFVPAVTMRLWAEERRSGTMEVLLTLPFRDVEIVVGKYLAAFAFLILTVILSFPIPLTIMKMGSPDMGPIIGGYVGAFLLGGAYLAIGMFISSLCDNQMIAFILSVVASFVLLIIGEPFVLQSIPDTLKPAAQYLGLSSHFQNIGKGVIDTRDVIYYFSVIFVFIYATMRKLESRLWA
ncbi:ABC transporter permease [bacterium]|nr:ABC transporter permease [bacterium]MBU1024573.1 ABC transporter permease [bacterium]